MLKYRLFSLFAVVSIFLLGYFYLVKPEIDARKDGNITREEKTHLFKLGLDLVGGSQLTYDADISKLKNEDVSDSMSALKETLMKRLNPFGTSEVSIVVEDESVFSENANKTKRLIIQIPGESDPEEAKKKIGKMPLMEFKILKPNLKNEYYFQKNILNQLKLSGKKEKVKELEKKIYGDEFWITTQLTGSNIKSAMFVINQQTAAPVTQVQFDEEGGKIFGELTKNNIGNIIGIFLDGKLISDPKINDSIQGGTTIISFGNNKYSEQEKEAKELAKNLKYGALPVKITPVSSNVISPSLGKDILEKGLMAGFWGLLTVMVFLILVYRISGLLASIALISYTILTLSLFKFFGFVFTAAGIAGFIISIGMAVDANVLIFEMIRDELRNGKKIIDAIKDGFERAWLSIRDGNISSILTAIILFYMTTSLVRGFALTFGFGVITSMFSAIVLTRVFLLAVVGNSNSQKWKKYL